MNNSIKVVVDEPKHLVCEFLSYEKEINSKNDLKDSKYAERNSTNGRQEKLLFII